WDVIIASGDNQVNATFSGAYETRVLTMNVVSKKGTIDFSISSRGCWLINALALVPRNKWKQTHSDILKTYENDIYLLPKKLLKSWLYRPHIEKKSMPIFTDSEKKRGIVLFHRSYLACIWPNTVPLRREIDREVRIFATLGEYEPITFTLLPLRDINDVRISFSPLKSAEGNTIDPADIAVKTVKYMYVRPNYKTEGVYYRAPDVLIPYDKPLRLTKMENRRVWATLHVNPKTPAGVYKGKATISTADGTLGEIAILVRVIPIVLEKDQSLTYAFYYRHPYDLAAIAPDAFSREWLRRRAVFEHRDMVAHGMNGIVLRCWAPAPKNGKWRFNFDALAETIDLLRSHGMTRPLPLSIPVFSTYRQYIKAPIGSHIINVQMPPKKFFNTITAMVAKIERERKIRKWPEFLYYPVDEPSTADNSVNFMLEVLKAIKRIPGVRTYVTADPEHEQFAPLRPYIDVWCCQPFNPDCKTVVADMKARPGVEYWCYPNHVSGENNHTTVTGARMTYGFGFWRSGFRTLIPWIYHYDNGNPWNYLDGSCMDFFNRTGDDAAPIPVAMYEAYREGIDDGRYVFTLKQWIERAKNAGRNDLAKKAESDLAYVWDSVKVQKKYKFDDMWDPEAFDIYRWILAQRIFELKNSLEWR
ncbi:MAG: hypothetical protein KAG97_11085, partial [Victivallales bacterium]|nr:hypothetical protein [Victivallales bacterium]